jgi:hypothetical protein
MPPGVNPSEVAEDDDLRSLCMEMLISAGGGEPFTGDPSPPPRLLVQFCDDVTTVPEDVRECLNSWAPLEDIGYKRLLFDDASATKFIEEYFTPRHAVAFGRCNHPAMRADYFRMCLILKVGGFYVDADDEYQ